MRPSKEYFIYHGLLITKKCPEFNHPESLDEIPRKHLLEMDGVFVRHDPKYEKMTMGELSELTGIKMRWAGGWKKILGVSPKYARGGWGRRKQNTED